MDLWSVSKFQFNNLLGTVRAAQCPVNMAWEIHQLFQNFPITFIYLEFPSDFGEIQTLSDGHTSPRCKPCLQDMFIWFYLYGWKLAPVHHCNIFHTKWQDSVFLKLSPKAIIGESYNMPPWRSAVQLRSAKAKRSFYDLANDNATWQWRICNLKGSSRSISVSQDPIGGKSKSFLQSACRLVESQQLQVAFSQSFPFISRTSTPHDNRSSQLVGFFGCFTYQSYLKITSLLTAFFCWGRKVSNFKTLNRLNQWLSMINWCFGFGGLELWG